MRFTSMRSLTCAAALFAWGAATGVALAASALPPVESQHGIDYMTGGIGQGEAKAIEQAATQWPLTMEFAQRRGHEDDFLANVHVVVRDAQRRTVLTATADGPFLLARLKPGRYAIDASFGDRTLHDNVQVGDHAHGKAVFVWPQGKPGNA